MIQRQVADINTLVRITAIDGQGLDELKNLCLDTLARAIDDEVTAREWFDALRSDAGQMLGFDLKSDTDFLEWAINRVRAYRDRPFRTEIRRFYAGDDRALDEVAGDMYDQVTRSAVRSYGRRIGHDEALDVAGEVMKRFFERKNDLKRRYQPERADFRTWASYQIKDFVKRRELKARKTMTSTIENMFESGVEPAVGAEAYVQALSCKRDKIEQDAIDKLGQRAAEMYRMYCKDDMTLDEVAGQLGLAVSTVSKQLVVARAKVEAEVRELGYELLDPHTLYTKAGKPKKEWIDAFFIHVVAIPLFRILERDVNWARSLEEILGPGLYLNLMGPQIKEQWVARAAEAVLALYERISQVDPDHDFCRRARDFAKGDFGKPIGPIID